MAIPPGVSPGASARSTAIPASGDGMFSGLPVAGDLALAGLGSTAFNPAWNYLGARGAPMTAEAAAEAAAAAKNMTWGQALKADVPHAYQRGYVPPAGQTKLPFWKMPATGGTPATRKLFETTIGALPKVARFAGPAGAAYGVGDLAYRGTKSLLDATGGTGALEDLGGSIYNLFNRPKEEKALTTGLAAGALGYGWGGFNPNKPVQFYGSPYTPAEASDIARRTASPTNPTTDRMIRALSPQQNPLKVDVPRPRPRGGGGGLFAGLGGLLSGAAPAVAWGLGLPLGMMWPSKISEEQGIVPESGPLTPQQLFKMRNDAEETQLRQGGVPNIPEVPEWNPQASIPPDFRVNERSMAALSPSVTYTPPPRRLGGSLEAMGELSRLDSRIADKYTTATSQGPVPTALLESLIPTTPEEGRPRYVETFAEPRTSWTPQAPVIPDIVVPPPAAAPTPYVEQFEEITPPRKVERRKPSQRAPKVVKKKVTKAKPKPRRVKQTAVQKALAKPAPRRVKYTPPKPKPAPRRVKYTPPEDPFAFEDRRGGRR